jgi:hypothetical protein
MNILKSSGVAASAFQHSIAEGVAAKMAGIQKDRAVGVA